MVRVDRQCAYPVVAGIPVLLAPEVLVPAGSSPAWDVSDCRYAEAYEELEYYNGVAESNEARVEDSLPYRNVARVLELDAGQRAKFPEPRQASIDSPYEPIATWEAYRHLAPLARKTVMQVGGRGTHAIKFLLAGAAEAWLVSPMIGELKLAVGLARHFGVEDRFHCAGAVAEELPFPASSFDGIYTSGCLHHTVTSYSLPESARVLKPDGRFAGVEPWRAPFYALGTKILGKREVDVHCRPMTSERCSPLFSSFDKAAVTHHGGLSRYPLLALLKLGVKISDGAAWHIATLDDALCSFLPPVRRMGSSVSLLASRAPDECSAQTNEALS